MSKYVCQQGADTKANTWGSGVLERPDSAVPRQVKREQLRVRSIQASSREVDVRLLRLDAADRDDLRHLGDDGQHGVSALTK